MNNESFRDLLQRYLDGKCTPYEVFMLHEWYDQLGEASQHTLSNAEKQTLEEQIWQNLKTELADKPLVPKPKLSWWQRHQLDVQRAAIVVLVIGIAVGLARQTTFVQQHVAQWLDCKSLTANDSFVQRVNQTKRLQKIALADGTVLWLAPGSQVTYPTQFARQKREVTLTGNAFFNVAKDARKPFLVYTGQLVTRVLGTSFWVRSNVKRNAVQVDVLTGKVSVYERSTKGKLVASSTIHQHERSVVLAPNQRVTYSSHDGYLTTGLVTKPVPLQTEPATINQVFSDTPLLSITQQFQRLYGIDIVLANDAIEQCTFTGDVTNLALYDKLRLICKSIGASCEISGTRLLITGDGCH